MGRWSVFLLLVGMFFATFDAMVSDIGGFCCVRKTVGGVAYTLITEDDTTKYGCQKNCVYTRDDQPAGNHFCFKAGNLESACSQDLDGGIIFIGPSWYSRESQLFLYPSLRKADCVAPPFPFSNEDSYQGYLAKMTDDGPLFCGGAIDTMFPTNRCFLLASNGTWTDMSPLPVDFAVTPSFNSVEFGDGWWIAGFDIPNIDKPNTGATLLWDGSAWQDYANLPKPLRAFCMTKINSTHVFLSGGFVNSLTGYNSIGHESYIYSNITGFVQIANMTTSRHSHTCGVLDERFVFVAGGSLHFDKGSEYFSLATMTWNDGPFVDYGSDPVFKPWDHRIVSKGSTMFLITDYNIFTLENADSEDENDWKWTKSADLEYTGGGKDAFLMNTADCKNWKV